MVVEIRKRLAKLAKLANHTRVVVSGSYPLYRLMALGAVMSGVVQLWRSKVPPSVGILYQGLPDEWDYVFIFMQLLGGVLILIALYMESDESPSSDKAHISLTVERTGLYFLGATIVVYTMGVLVQNSGLPNTMVSWFGVAFLLYLIRRASEIRKALRELRS